MIKRASTILLTLFLLLTSAQVWGQSCPSTTFSNTSFAPNNTSETYYGLDQITYTTGIPLTIKSSLAYEESNKPERGKYSVSNNALRLGCVKTGTLLSIKIPNLSTGNGSNQYKIKFTAEVELRSRESDASENHRYNFKLSTTGANQQIEYNTSNFQAVGPVNNMELSFTATNPTMTVSLTTDNSGDCYILKITNIQIIGCIQPTITSSNGEKLCMGEENTFKAVGFNGTVTWELNGTTVGTGNSYTSTFHQGGTITATDGTSTISFPFTTQLCCSSTANTINAYTQTFNYDYNTAYPSISEVAPGASCAGTYTKFNGGGSVLRNQYAIINSSANAGEHWKDPATPEYTTQGADKNERFLFINCDVEEEVVFRYNISDQEFCRDTKYEFSTYIANIDDEAVSSDGTVHTPVNVKLTVYGYNTQRDCSRGVNKIFIKETTSGNITDFPSGWLPLSFIISETEAYPYMGIEIANNVDRNDAHIGNGEVIGNDLGIDNISFSRCVPRINVSFDNTLKNFSKNDECDGSGITGLTLHVGYPDYDVDELLSGGYFIVQQKTGSGNWTRVTSMTEPVKFEDNGNRNGIHPITVNIVPNQGVTQYRAIIATRKEDVEEVEEAEMQNREPSFSSTCSVYSITRNEELATFTPSCTNQSETPVVTDYTNCPPSDGKYDLYNSITQVTKDNGDNILTPGMTPEEKRTAINAVGKITFYPVDPNNPTATQPALADNAYIIDYPSSGNSVIYKATFQQTVGGTFTTSAFSDNIVITCLETIEFTMNTESITGCSGTLDSDDSRTFKIENIEPSSLTSSDINFIWKLKDPITGTYNNITGTEANNTYTVPTTGSGEMQVLIEPKPGSTQACASTTKDLSYNIADNPNFEIEGTVVPCKDKLTDDGVVVNLKELRGSTTLKITRTAKDENNIVSTTIFTSFEEAGSFKVINYNEETEFAFIDTYFDAQYFSAGFDVSKIVSVQYNIVLGIETTDCKDEKSTETFGINSTNNFSLKPSENVKDINDDSNIVEYHVCKGENVTVTSNYREQSGGLQPGEYYEWYVNGVLDPEAEIDNKNYTITSIEENTTIKVVLAAELGTETCGGEAEITIYVDKKPEVSVENLVLCEGDSDTFEPTGSADSFTWTPATYLSSTTTTYPIFTAETAGEFEYSLEVTKGVCIVTIKDIKATVNPLPEFVYINVNTNEDGINVLDVEINGNSPYYYSLDGEIYGKENTLPTSLPIGWSVLYVKDKYDCKSSHNFEVEPTPIRPDKFFTPNGDGNNDLWTVENLEIYPSYIIEIFDRHGKRLYIKRVGSFNGDKETYGSEPFGWDGNYNGHQLPSDDYWYLITLEEVRKQYTGHFTLKR